jgi:hypothetical protein
MTKKNSFIGNIVGSVRALRNTAKTVNQKFDISGSQARSLRERTTYLSTKYNDQNIVEALLAGRYWIGQPAEQLQDSLGSPAAIDEKNMATRHRQIWKYYPTGVNRYQLRITMDDGIVATWDSKDHE